MVFNSMTFVLFLIIVLIAHRLPLPWKIRKFNLLIFSYLFYMAWNPPFVLLLVISTIIDWFAASKMAKAPPGKARKFWLLLSLCSNLGMLAFFKYGMMLQNSFRSLTQSLGWNIEFATWSIILPVGISFYTFQTLSYTIDVYRNKQKPWNSFLDFALYVSFFPQLVAGPIVRASQFLPQCKTPHKVTSPEFSWGLALLVIGLFQKVVLADTLLSPVVEQVYSHPNTVGTIHAWIGTLAFASQIFYDFAGYSLCAIGVAMMLGFHLPDNFKFPYAAVGFSDFWKRWHISLSTWLRDYLYIPLGGNRCSSTRIYLNLMIVMILGGLWHGAAWRFVAWGTMHGTFLLLERLIVRKWGNTKSMQNNWIQWLLSLATFAMICLTWTFFRANTFQDAFQILHAMFIPTHATTAIAAKFDMLIAVAITIGTLITHWNLRNKTLEDVWIKFPWWCRSILLALMLIAILLAPGDDRAFIYFQF